MTMQKLTELLEEQLKRKIQTKINKIEELEQIEKELKINIDVYANEKHPYISKKEYPLSIEFMIKNSEDGKIKDQHNLLRMSAQFSRNKENGIDQLVEELKLPTNLKTFVNVAKYLLHDSFKYYKMDPISWEEKSILDTIGMKARYYSKPGQVKNIYDYDINSMHSFLLSNKNFRFPVSEGKYEEITEIDKTKFGIYKLNILSEIDERLFTKNEAYDSYDIELLDYLGYKYELAEKKAYMKRQ